MCAKYEGRYRKEGGVAAKSIPNPPAYETTPSNTVATVAEPARDVFFFRRHSAVHATGRPLLTRIFSCRKASLTYEASRRRRCSHFRMDSWTTKYLSHRHGTSMLRTPLTIRFSSTRMMVFEQLLGTRQIKRLTELDISFNVLSHKNSTTKPIRSIHRSLVSWLSKARFFWRYVFLNIQVEANIYEPDTLTYWALLTGVMRAGYTCFVVSPRNSSAALTHLLKATQCQALFVSSDEPMQSLSRTAIANVDKDIAIGRVPEFTDVFTDDGSVFTLLPSQAPDSMDVPALITHTSGSFSFTLLK